MELGVYENPVAFAGSLRQTINDAVELIDDAMRRSREGAIDIMYIGGDSKCWQEGENGVGP
eukprot:6825297-Pyramimonas_sp.AAC.1